MVINCNFTAFLLGREMCGKEVQVITNYLPLASYLIEREHDSIVIMGGQYNKTQSITLAPQDGDTTLYAGHYQRYRPDREFQDGMKISGESSPNRRR